ncbi:acyl-ACP desaturase [Chitinophagaceae bacterium LB-8]|uniref:Acyl-ACP desaturase n=1 Tax=Paraflavisolibacter caeni TaxID=2982496 RepID=A0A9X2XUV1_9BACT|nr:acyl-ACP desaturase [Paraflavisolibacter caeni]MCU7548937.1 acyl-ACP desaturase [Paraflavisolibacter caeni]
MAEKVSRAEVMKHLDKGVLDAIPAYLKPIDDIWQPADLLPKSEHEEFYDQIKELQKKASNLTYDLLVVLIGDTITEEALPTYESWLSSLHPINEEREGGWNQWVRAWTAEENRHGDILNKYLYLSGRINMRAMEISTQYLLADGFDIGTTKDPYRNFVYTSFQELATNLSHRRVAKFAKKEGDDLLAKICGNVASDEARHASAYKSFVSKIFEVDPSEMMIAFEDMMRKKIVMPAHFLREKGTPRGDAFRHFSEVAQRIGVYTGKDYIHILHSLIKEWHIEKICGLNEAGEKARDYIMALPARLHKLTERMTPQPTSYKFSWINA